MVKAHSKSLACLTVNYNTPEYLERLLKTFRQFYDTPYLVLDGSDAINYEKIRDFDKKYNVRLIHFNYNIHHGPGMAYGIQNMTSDQILLIDSDIIFHHKGIIENMVAELNPFNYGIGDIQKEYFIKPADFGGSLRRAREAKKKGLPLYEKEWIDYLHPAFALINRELAIKLPLPFKGGAPMINAMKYIYEKKLDILQRSQDVTDDFWKHTKKYIQHNHNCEGMGTVVKTGGYHLVPEKRKK